MSNKPIFVATHPRACSTAFERVFMTRRDSLNCIHEPFGDAFYYGPERLSSRFAHDEKGRIESGFQDSTFKTVLDRIEIEGAEGKRLFIKDIIHYLVPPNGAPPSIAPSLERKERGVGTLEPSTDSAMNGTSKRYTNGAANDTNGGPCPFATDAEPGNPTVVPKEILDQFHFTFLIRHPRYSIPSYYRCTVPPLDRLTGFYEFMPSEAGYNEVRRVFEYLRSVGQIGPKISTHESNGTQVNGNSVTNCHSNKINICVVDADDLLDNPKGMIEAYCNSVGIEYDPEMLNWNSEEDQKQAKVAFEKWPGFHEDAMNSCDLKPRLHKKQPKSNDVEDGEWREKFGAKGAKVIRETVDANVEDYEYLKKFALRA